MPWSSQDRSTGWFVRTRVSTFVTVTVALAMTAWLASVTRPLTSVVRCAKQMAPRPSVRRAVSKRDILPPVFKTVILLN